MTPTTTCRNSGLPAPVAARCPLIGPATASYAGRARRRAVMTTATTTTMPRAMALPTFSWPSSTSELQGAADLQREIGEPWETSAAAVA